MKLLLAALTISSLPFLTSTRFVESITLTNERPTGSFALQRALLEHPPAVLEVSLTKVVNPKAKAINVFVYFSGDKKTDSASRKIEVGNFSLYPADRPGKFMLDAAPAFRKLAETKDAAAKEWRVVFELERPAEQAAAQIEVTIAAPNWKSEKASAGRARSSPPQATAADATSPIRQGVDQAQES